MKVVIALDSFKGSLPSVEACRIVAEAIRESVPTVQAAVKPMADGGEGTAKALMAAAGGKWVRRRVMGPLEDMQVDAGFVWWKENQTALVEMATASGMELLKPEQLNPMRTTTYGTGELVREARDFGARKILLAVGGSATVDGGVGAAAALGWGFFDAAGRKIPLGGAALCKIERIRRPDNHSMPETLVLCDVDNPLCGPRGAARVYGPQKGAGPEMVEQLEAGLSHLAAVVKEQLGAEIGDVPGAGAAGGLAAGAIAFMNGKVVSGIERVCEMANLEREMEGSDWVITGEGSFDSQSLQGKVVSGVCRLAKRLGVPSVVLAGRAEVGPESRKQLGIIDVFTCRKEMMTTEYAMKHSRQLLREAAGEFAAKYLAG